ncbi:IS3 family transposase [Streptomyces sp. NPDC050423]|uniref:IS3 family transposase n=1 Tax=Streptomyces sp. NPDC050423 TaxID=3155402 RepID=UPI00343BD962
MPPGNTRWSCVRVRVRMYRTSDPKPQIKKLAVDLGVHPEALRGWIRQAEADAGERDDRLTTDEHAELVALQGERPAQAGERRTTDGLGIFRGATRPDPAQVTALLDEHPHLGVECVLRELSIAPSTYYRWRRAEKEPCERRRRDVELTEQIKEIHTQSGGIYRSPRVHAMLKREGVHAGRKRVERLMREADLAGLSPRRN